MVKERRPHRNTLPLAGPSRRPTPRREREMVKTWPSAREWAAALYAYIYIPRVLDFSLFMLSVIHIRERKPKEMHYRAAAKCPPSPPLVYGLLLLLIKYSWGTLMFKLFFFHFIIILHYAPLISQRFHIAPLSSIKLMVVAAAAFTLIAIEREIWFNLRFWWWK